MSVTLERGMVTNRASRPEVISSTSNNIAGSARRPADVSELEALLVEGIKESPHGVEVLGAGITVIGAPIQGQWHSFELNQARLVPNAGHGIFVLSADINTTRSWQGFVTTTALRTPSRFELLQSASAQLIQLKASGEASPSHAAARALSIFVASFARDGGPTPQLTSTPSGSIEVAWVSGGTAVGAIFAEDGTYSVWAQSAPGVDLFDLDVDDAMSLALHDRIAGLLDQMSRRIGGLDFFH